MTATKEKWDKSMFTECLFVPNKINLGFQQNLFSKYFLFKDCPLVLVTLIYENVLASRDNLSLSQNLRTCPAVASGNLSLSERHLQQQQKREATLKERAEVPLASVSDLMKSGQIVHPPPFTPHLLGPLFAPSQVLLSMYLSLKKFAKLYIFESFDTIDAILIKSERKCVGVIH